MNARPRDDRGFSLIEVLVAMTLFGIVATVLLTLALTQARMTDDVAQAADFTGESRLALERMNRELRQASAIDRAELGTDVVALTFWTDFDGDGQRDLSAVDPEVLTYRWTRESQRLTLTADDASGTSVTRPVLAGKVVAVDVDLRSSLWQYDGADGSAPDGLTTWRELDRAGGTTGNGNGVPDVELASVDLVAVRLVVAEGNRRREFVMQADLRNRELG